MDDPIFTYGILKYLLDNNIKFTKIIFLENPEITFKRIIILFLVYGPIYFFEFVGAYFWWNIFKEGRIKSLCKSRCLEYCSYSNTQLNEVTILTQNIAPDLIISINCNVLLPDFLLNTAKFGGVNLHHGSLPFYKGLMPVFYSQLARQKKVGSSIHLMNSKFDSGAILIQEEISIIPGENYVKIWKRLNIIGALNLLKILNFFELNSVLPSTIVQESVGCYYSLPSIRLAFKYFIMQCNYKFSSLSRQK